MDRFSSHSQPLQDLAGVKTWVQKTRQDGVQNDTSAPDKSREDYADGKPQRDRVLPLPSGHPKGRDEQRVGPPIHNVPSDSAGNTNTKPKSEFAIPDQPDGKPLHQRPRSSGIPGDQYGNPYIDQSTSTGLKRRVLSSEMEGGFFGRAKIRLRPPLKRQRKTKGRVRRVYDLYRNKLKRRNRSKIKFDLKRYYRRNKRRILMYQKRRRKSPERYKRYEGGGYSSLRKKYRDQRKKRGSLEMFSIEAMKKEAVRNVMGAMYKEFIVPLDERNSEELEAWWKFGPGSRSRPKQQKQRAIRKRRTTSWLQKARRKAKKYYRRNKNKIKRRVKKWRRRFKNVLHRYKKPKTRRASISLVLNIPCNLAGCDSTLLSLFPIQNMISANVEDVGYVEMPLSHFFAFVDWHDPSDEMMLEELYVEGFSDFFNMRVAGRNVPTDPKLWAEILSLVKGESKEPVCRDDVCSNPVRKGDGFQTYPSAYANGYGLKEYRRLGGGWKKKSNMDSSATLSSLQVLLALLRAVHWSHWTSHWQVQGENSYSDHLLLERLYTGLVEEIDTLAEKIVGYFGAEAVNSVDQAQMMANAILPQAELQMERDPVKRALIVEESLQKAFKEIYKILDSSNQLSLGMDDFIMSVANAHETNVYLLRQRTRKTLSKYASSSEKVKEFASINQKKYKSKKTDKKVTWTTAFNQKNPKAISDFKKWMASQQSAGKNPLASSEARKKVAGALKKASDKIAKGAKKVLKQAGSEINAIKETPVLLGKMMSGKYDWDATDEEGNKKSVDDMKKIWGTAVYVGGCALTAMTGGAGATAIAFGKSLASHAVIGAVSANADFFGFLSFEAGETVAGAVGKGSDFADTFGSSTALFDAGVGAVKGLISTVAEDQSEVSEDEAMQKFLKGYLDYLAEVTENMSDEEMKQVVKKSKEMD